MNANKIPIQSKKKLVLLMLCALVVSLAACSSSQRKLKGAALMQTTFNAERSQATILYFEDNTTCQVHTYYYLDDLHLQQTFPYTITNTERNAAEVLINGQSYQLRMDGQDISVTDSENNPYIYHKDKTAEELIAELHSEIQSQHGMQLLAEKELQEERDKQQEEREKQQLAEREQLLKANEAAAHLGFNNVSYWVDYDMADMLYYIFDPYPTITCEPDGDSVTRFVFTVSGSYYINKAQLPSLKEYGTMVAVYDVETGKCTIREGKEIYDAMNMYYFYGLDGGTKEALKGLYGE